MANTKSAKKRARQTVRRTTRNTQAKSSVKTAVRAAREAIESSSKDLEAMLKSAISKLSKAANKGLIHKKNASRKISRLMSRSSNVKASK